MQITFEVRDAIEISERAIEGIIFDSIRDVATFFDNRELEREDLATYPRRRQWPQDYPLEWSDNERRAYFAMRASQGLPPAYQRTNTLRESWGFRAVQIPDGGILIFQNTAPYAKDVYGDFFNPNLQKIYHRMTGWPTLNDYTERIIDQLVNSVQEEIQRNFNSVILKRR